MIFVDGLLRGFDLGFDCPHMTKTKRADGSRAIVLCLRYTSDGVVKNASFVGDIVSSWGGIFGNELC